MTAWTWESRAPGAGGCGVSGDEDEAKAAAVAGMREHEAAAARTEPVQLDVMESAYVPAGQAIEAATHDDNRITWRPAAR
jgi:hypothetical protein